ncbi:MAG: hypothetical protein R6V50_03640 [Thermoplasmatota archaeon]
MKMSKNKFKKKAGVFLILLSLLMISFSVTASHISDEKNSVSQKNQPNSLFDDWDVLIQESFEDEWVPDSNGDLAPYRWEMEQTTGEIMEIIPCWWHQYEEMGENYAGLWWGFQPQDEWLMTPPLDLSVYTEAILEFETWNFGQIPGFWEGNFVKVSIDGANTWETLVNLYELAPPGGQFFGEHMLFDLTSYCGESAVIVAFHRLTEDPNMNVGWWMIDNVLINAGGMIPIPVVDIGTIGGGFGVKASIVNYGTGIATNALWEISFDSGLILIGGNSGSEENIDPSEEIDITSGLVFGLGSVIINVSAGDMWTTAEGFVIGPFVLAVKAKNYVPIDNNGKDFTINWAQCTITIRKAGENGLRSVQFVDKDGNILGSKSGIRFTAGSATFSVENWMKNKLNAGGSINIR